MTNPEKEVAKLTAIQYDSITDDVLVVFKVISDEYKELVLKMARRDDIEIIIRGERLFVKQKDK